LPNGLAAHDPTSDLKGKVECIERRKPTAGTEQPGESQTKTYRVLWSSLLPLKAGRGSVSPRPAPIYQEKNWRMIRRQIWSKNGAQESANQWDLIVEEEDGR